MTKRREKLLSKASRRRDVTAGKRILVRDLDVDSMTRHSQVSFSVLVGFRLHTAGGGTFLRGAHKHVSLSALAEMLLATKLTAMSWAFLDPFWDAASLMLEE